MQFQARQRGQAASAQFRTQQNQQIMQMNQQRNQAFQDARMRQQSAVSSQATNRVQQGFQQSQAEHPVEYSRGRSGQRSAVQSVHLGQSVGVVVADSDKLPLESWLFLWSEPLS